MSDLFIEILKLTPIFLIIIFIIYEVVKHNNEMKALNKYWDDKMEYALKRLDIALETHIDLLQLAAEELENKKE
jgi:hypothetical protein